MAVTGLRLERLLDVNPQEALPHRSISTERPRKRPARVSNFGEHTDAFRDREMYRMRTRPELYDEWMVQIAHNARAQVAEALDQYDWDCTKCERSVFTRDIYDACPRCGA